jgi:hypothetical protein
MESKRKRKINFSTDILLHFTYASSLAHFNFHFHQIWREIFEGTSLDDIPVIYASRLTDNLKHLLVKKKPDKKIDQTTTNIISTRKRLRKNKRQNKNIVKKKKEQQKKNKEKKDRKTFFFI